MIICKGFKKNGNWYPCDFIYGGEWGSEKLIDHEKYHKSLENGKSYFWLGFEVKRGFSTLTQRDGKP